MNQKFIALLVLFLLSRIYILTFHRTVVSSDLNFLALYALNGREQLEAGRSPYEGLSSILDQQNIHFLERDEYKKVAYPPLAIAVMLGAAAAIPQEGITKGPTEAAGIQWIVNFRMLLFAFEFIFFTSLLLSYRLIGFLPACLYLLWSTTQFDLIYDRLDIVSTSLLGLGFLSLCILPEKKRIWSLLGIFWVLATGYRMIPIYLCPVLPLLFSRAKLEWIFSVFILFLLGSTPFFIAWLIWGHSSLDWLQFNQMRPLHMESFFGNILVLFDQIFNLGCHLEHSYGSFNVSCGGFEKWISKSTGLIQVIVGFALPGIVLTHCSFTKTSKLDRLHSVFLLSLSSLSACMVLGKVFSPQFIINLLPLAALLGQKKFKTGSTKIFYAMTLIVLLNVLVFPILFETFIVHKTQGDTEFYGTKELSTVSGSLIILLRNFSVLYLAKICVSHALSLQKESTIRQ